MRLYFLFLTALIVMLIAIYKEQLIVSAIFASTIMMISAIRVIEMKLDDIFSNLKKGK